MGIKGHNLLDNKSVLKNFIDAFTLQTPTNSRRWMIEDSQVGVTPEKDLESCENLYWFPQYLNEVCPNKSQYNIEWKAYLLSKNSEEVRKSVNSQLRFTFYTPKIVKSVFNICKILRQPPEVRYLALAVLDRFLVEHFFSVRETFEEMEDRSMETWQAVVERMLKQAPLRILSSVQLAMKYSWSRNVITATDIQAMLEFLGHKDHYPKKSILKSEARVLQNLNFNIPNNTPLTYLEMFFDDFQRHEFFNTGVSLHMFFTTCIHALDVAVIFHQEIYANLTDINQQSSTFSMKANYVLLAASVIFASSVLENPNINTSKVLRTLCSSGECRKSDIQALGKELLHVILRN